MNVRQYIEHHYRHFNAATVIEAARAYEKHLEAGGRMFVTLAGAMSTAELGLSLAEMIRQDKIHGICCTGANLEEDIFNLVAHNDYQRIPDWRNLTPQQEKDLEHRGLNRVTDTCIPEETAFRAIENQVLELWQRADKNNERFFPHEFMYQLLREGWIKDSYQIDPKDSWLIAAAEKNLPIFVPGWEDSTLGNIFVSHVITGELSGCHIVKSGTEYMKALAAWYVDTTMGKDIFEIAPDEAGSPDGGIVQARTVSPDKAKTTIGFFQIGGGIAGDFPICVVPMIHQDLRRACPYWAYFCQISDSTTSYGSYSGAIPTEKITWGKLDVDTPRFIIESDATIVAPLIFAYLLNQ
ncbi:deoxyhypusine synthase family protein [Planctomycetales bacterium ZRK34]|nr:deoxyhypusine synthase family protein [Planctomycetales bacterium ZRK34]